jgi:16S rRNA processing protein RimM
VRDESGVEIGTVSAIHNFGAGDILEVRRDGGPSIMIPFTRAAVPEVAPARGLIRVDSVAAGLVDDEDSGAREKGGTEPQ